MISELPRTVARAATCVTAPTTASVIVGPNASGQVPVIGLAE